MSYEQDLNQLTDLVDPDPSQALQGLRRMDASYQCLPHWQKMRTALLIDIGRELRRAGIVREGLDAVAELEIDWQSCYWKGNAYQLLHELTPAESFGPRSTTLPLAKAAYREAIAQLTPEVPKEAAVQLWTNYGNTLSRRSGIGRNLEAIQAYQSALNLDPDFGMALGNLAIEMDDFVWVSHTCGFLEEALVCVEKALACPDIERFAGPQAGAAFEVTRERIMGHLAICKGEGERQTGGGEKQPFPDATSEPGPAERAALSYQEWCAAHNLFLDFSITSGTRGVMRTDSLLFRRLSGEAEAVLPLFRLLNEIKEAFVTARWLLYQACVPPLDCSEIDAATAYVFNPDYGVYGVRVGTLKAAFQLCYDILDKLGLCLYRRLCLTQPVEEWRISFHTIWGKHDLSDAMTDLMTGDSSRFLYALYDLSRDLDRKTGYYRRLREVRNSLTHTYVLPHLELGGWHEDWDRAESHAYLPDLRKDTLQLFTLVRAAIVYFVCLVDRQERQNSLDRQGVPTIRTDLQTYDSKLLGDYGWR